MTKSDQPNNVRGNLETPSTQIKTVVKAESVLAKDPEWNEMREKMSLAVRSGLLPASVTYEKAVVIAAYGREIGLTPLNAIKEIYVVDGKACMSSALMKGLVHQRLPNALFKITESSPEKCVIVTKRDKDDPNEPLATWTFTLEEAKQFYSGKNGIKDNWKKHPADMLRARCISRACRGEFSDVFLGPVYDHEELEDLRLIEGKKTDNEKHLERFNQEMIELGKESNALVVS